MSIVGGIVVFTIIWWTVLFVVLPLGIQRNEAPERGHDAGAPANPRILYRLGLTTAISTVLFIVAYFIITSDVLVLSRD